MKGRPLRFVALTLACWTMGRVYVLLPVASRLPVLRAAAPFLPTPAQAAPAPVIAVVVRPAADRAPALPRIPAAVRRAPPGSALRRDDVEIATAADVPPESTAASVLHGAIPPPLRPNALAEGASRLAGSVWLLARGGANGTLTGGRLGGSQAGARLTYALDAGRHIALAARIATPLAGRGREAAVGIDWQPTHAPLHIVAEQRFALDGGRGGPTLMAIGGVGPVDIARLRFESYAQGGIIARGGAEGFADGAARLTRRIVRVGRSDLDLGVGAWGAVQRDAARIDIGPTVGLVVPIGARAVRLTIDWRRRVAGRARPGSGPALSLGSDF